MVKNTVRWIISLLLIGTLLSFSVWYLKSPGSWRPNGDLALKYFRDQYAEKIFLNVLVCLVLGVGFTCASRLFFWTDAENLNGSMYPRYLIADKSGNTIAIVSNGEFVWDHILRRWERDAYKIVGWCDRFKNITMSIQPITTNPKVRYLEYVVDFDCGGTLDEANKQYSYLRSHPSGAFDNLEAFLEWSLYQFQEQESTRLGEFFNPRDAGQQQRFNQLARSALTPLLEPAGITCIQAKFFLNSFL